MVIVIPAPLQTSRVNDALDTLLPLPRSDELHGRGTTDAGGRVACVRGAR